MGKKKMEVSYKTDWRSLYVLTLVTFLDAFKAGTNSSNLWPYITLHDPTITESFYGLMISVSNFANLLVAFVIGWVSNQIQHTKPAILTGKVLALIGAFLYLSVELIDSHQRVIFIAMEVFFGLGLGFSSLTRTYVAMSSTEKHRPRAFAIISLAITLGQVVGPLIMVLMINLKYPGFEIGSTGLHLNFYSAPIYLLIITVIVSLVLLVFFFDGKMRLLKTIQPIDKEFAENKIVIDPSTLPKNERYDKLAVFVCCATRFLMTISMVFGHSLSSPYMIAAFNWSASQFVFISSIIHTLTGLIGVFWSIMYMSGFMKNKLSERRAIVIAIVMKLIFFLITYPWPIYKNTISYEVLSVNETTGKTSILENGCKSDYEWCQYTPAVNPYVFCISQIILLGFSIPLMHLNLEILYSKILGQIKQGTLQGTFIICGDILQVFGPVLLTQLYQVYGVKYVWLLIISVMVIILGLWITFYDRMISSSRRIQQLVHACDSSTT